MSAPTTPPKPRPGALKPGAASPARPSTPGSRKPTAAATASPQIRAALAALRQKRQPSADSVASPSLAPAPDRVTTPARSSTSTRRDTGVREVDLSRDAPVGDGDEQQPDAHGVILEWNVKGEDKLVEAARKTGRLNLASRGLSSVLPTVYSALLPRSSLYHPSKRNPSHYRQGPQPDLSMAAAAEGDERTAAWYEQQDLRALNLANNEIESVGDELGGFEELEVLDLHNNLLSTIPASVGYLVNLTSLSLAHNRLAAFPLQVLNLKHLRDLSLAHNHISHLWAADWRPQLDAVLEPPEKSPSATPESNNGREAPSFWDSFPSSPVKRSAAAAAQGAPSTTAPFPVLATLSLAGNPLAADALTAPGFELPPRLVSLDLSACGLTDRAVPPLVIGTLSALKELDLSANDLSDDLFSATLFSPTASPEPPRLFPFLDTLTLSLNPLDSLDSLEAFLCRHVRRPTTYTGLAHVLDNLVRNDERRTGRRIGVPAPARPDEGTDAAAEGKELRVLVRECPLRLEQARRRARFPASATSAARVAAAAASAAAPSPRSDKHALASSRTRTASPSPPPSPSPAGAGTAAAAAAASPSSTPARRRPVVLEDWEVEAAAGLATPGARRRAAALKVQAEREERERMAREADEELRRKKEAAEERERAREREGELAKRLEAVELSGRDEKRAAVPAGGGEEAGATSDEPSDQGSPPPYSPRSPATAVATPAPAPAPAPVPQHAAPAPSPSREADSTDPAVELVAPAFSRGQTKSTVVLSGRSLSSFAAPTTGAPPAALTSPSHADLSRNLLPSLPLAALAAWGWSTPLRALNLANNRIAALEVLGAGSAGAAPLFPSLDSLDLSSNFLPSSVASPFPSASPSSLPPGVVVDVAGNIPLLAALAALAPSLSTLSLRGNRLTSLSGIGALLAPSSVVPGSTARGVRRLDLAECRIRTVDDLCAVAERYGADEGGARASWRCDELDLSMNDIALLPPKLGLLPPALVLHLVGNTFRLPRRDVYENAGERLVIPWLKERL
ncbi:hypothetical protein JCM3775_005324 [Rhodotorula graminis]